MPKQLVIAIAEQNFMTSFMKIYITSIDSIPSPSTMASITSKPSVTLPKQV
jgi:hypothetical protein